MTGCDEQTPFLLVQIQGDIKDEFQGHYLGRAKGTDPYLAPYTLAWEDAHGVELQLSTHRAGHTALIDTFGRGDVLCRNIQLEKRKLSAEVVGLIKTALADA